MWFAADAVLALVFVWIAVESLRSNAYVDEFGALEGWEWLLALAPTLLLPARRLAPVTTLGLATVLYMLASGWQGDSNALLAIPFFVYSVAITRPAHASGVIVAVSAIALSTVVLYGPGDPEWLAVPVMAMLVGVGWLVALSIRRNQSRAHRLAIEALDLRRENEVVAERAVADERARIARELHDAVGHAVNVMVLQAGAARLSADDPRTAASLREIEQVGRSALDDLDHMLGLLHGDEHAPLEPVHGSDDIARLVTEMSTAGVDVHLHDECTTPIERSVGTAAYRIVQEALTNAIKHAGPARIDVTLTCTDDDLTITVDDDGVGPAADASSRSGRGIVGMRERASVLGGRLEAEARRSGGFRVRCELPRRPTPRRSGTSSVQHDLTGKQR